MPRPKRQVESGLINKGFRTTESHHRFFLYYTAAGEKTAVRTRTSQGRGIELDDFLLGQMAKQCHLSKADFLQLVDCYLSQTDYEKKLGQSHKI